MFYHLVLAGGWKPLILDVFLIISILCAISIIINKNPIVSVLFLIGLFLSVSCYLVFIGLEFIGLSYLLVYVGAVSILFLFILMLINVRISELLSDTSKTIPLVIVIGILFNFISDSLLPFSIIKENFYGFFFNKTDSLYLVTSYSWDSYLSETSHISSLGSIMYTNYSMWLIITSIILLLSMVGTILITIKP